MPEVPMNRTSARPEPSISRRGTLAVTTSTIVAAGSGYLILFIAARSLGPSRYAQFSVFWALYFAVLGVLFGLQQEATRSASASVVAPSTARSSNTVRIVRATLGIGAIFGVIIAVSGLAWSRSVFPSGPVALTSIVVIAGIAYGGQTGLLGALGGSRRWGSVALVVTTEAVVRLVAVAAAAWAGWGVGGLALATGSASIAWIVVCTVSTGARAGLSQRGDGDAREFRSRSIQTMAAAAASAALVSGFPVMLELTTPAGLGAVGGPLVLAITLTRAPLLVPLNAFQGVAIAHFVAHRGSGLRALRRPALGLAAVGLVGALAAWLVGAQIMTIAFGAEFRVAPVVLAWLTIAATLVAGLTLTGSAVIADDRHRTFTAGWVAASAIAATVLLAPGTLTTRAIASLIIGPACGIVVHLVALARRRTLTDLPH
jgi:O-antigen/teichoic acid export membrane protein